MISNNYSNKIESIYNKVFSKRNIDLALTSVSLFILFAGTLFAMGYSNHTAPWRPLSEWTSSVALKFGSDAAEVATILLIAGTILSFYSFSRIVERNEES